MSEWKDYGQIYRFKVFLGSVEAGDFTAVAGLNVTKEVIEVHEGGENTKTHKLVGQTRYSTILLRQGSSSSLDLCKWIQDAIAGDVERKAGSIWALNKAGDPILKWDFRDAWPCRYQGPDFSALRQGEPLDGLLSRRGQLAIEVLELSHRGFSVSRGGGGEEGGGA